MLNRYDGMINAVSLMMLRAFFFEDYEKRDDAIAMYIDFSSSSSSSHRPHRPHRNKKAAKHSCTIHKE